MGLEVYNLNELVFTGMAVTHIACTTSLGGGRGTSFVAQTFMELDSTKAGLVTPSRRRSPYKENYLTRASTWRVALLGEMAWQIAHCQMGWEVGPPMPL